MMKTRGMGAWHGPRLRGHAIVRGGHDQNRDSLGAAYFS